MSSIGLENKDEIIKTELNNGVAQILGYMGDELILTCESRTQKYYFHSKLSVDPKLFNNHKFGNWYDYLLKSHALPLKAIVDKDQFTSESVATAVVEMKLENSLFELPACVKTTKSPY